MANHLVYIVDDDEDDRLLLEGIFTDFFEACRLRFFENGAQLLTTLTHQLDERPPAVIVLDLEMPVLNGFETLHYLKNNPDFRRIPTVVLASSNRSRDKVRCAQLGSNEYVVKETEYYQWIGLVSRLHTRWVEAACP